MKCPVCEKTVEKGKSYCANCGWSMVEDGSVYGTLFGNEQQKEYEERQKLYRKFVRSGADEQIQDAGMRTEPQNAKSEEGKANGLKIPGEPQNADTNEELAAAKLQLSRAEAQLEENSVLLDAERMARQELEGTVASLRADMKKSQTEAERWKQEAERKNEGAQKRKNSDVGDREIMEIMLCGVLGVFVGMFVSGWTEFPFPIFNYYIVDVVLSTLIILVGGTVAGSLLKVVLEIALQHFFPKLKEGDAIVLSDMFSIAGIASIVYCLITFIFLK